MSERKESITGVFEVFTRRPKLLVIALMLYAGLGLVYVGVTGQDISPLLREYGLAGLGILVSFAAVIMQFEEIRKRREEIDERVSSVDERRRSTAEMDAFRSLRNELAHLKESQQVDYKKIEEILTKSEQDKSHRKDEMYKNFSSYFDGLREFLENKSADADEKASILLDKGTAYSKFGIVFFIIAIIGWQILSAFTGFKEQYIYGIVSCSLLFVFVEFLSAWFLRQYRNYVDTSTYLVKIKSIFDRYMLSHLALIDSDKDMSALTNILSDDIKWPETYLMKNADVGFAKEAMEAMTYMAQTVKKEAKNKKTENA
ncbi:hypothetical protein [Pseudoalteromonas phenolica]|uniref:hypothetical protein n=1 Tax=Pseudoalteromonas phenolica TaxID=161398 RepID=UPI00110BD98C|nr:hypothetical protein [Pseudoalteromonas phenolica]TMO55949.1 hypothetical protein CWC21_08470 [Pseudoalteromonas phenolica]